MGWGCQLFGDLIEHWERRGAPALKRMDPDKLDRKLLLSLVEQHGYDDIAARMKQDTRRLIEGGGFREYFHPQTGEGLGGADFSWSAAAWLVWAGKA